MDNKRIVEKYLHYLEHNLGRSIKTIAIYENNLKALSVFINQNNKLLIQANRLLLEEFVGIHAHKSGIAISSRKTRVASVRGFYQWMQDNELIVDNPAKFIKYPKVAGSLPLPIEIKYAEKLLNSIDLSTFSGVRDAAIIALFLGTGMRLSGVSNLNESNFIWSGSGLNSRLFIRVEEKGKKERVIPVPDTARLYLQAYLGHEELEEVNRRLPNGDQVIFISLRGRRIPEHEYYGEKRRLSNRYIQKMIIKYGEKVGIPRKQLRPHAFRHLYGTELAEDAVDLKRIQMLMGHSSTETTDVYIHLAIRELADVVNKSSPLNKMETPMHGILKHMSKHGKVKDFSYG